MRRDDVPELGVDLGAVKPRAKKRRNKTTSVAKVLTKVFTKPKLAVGSGEFRELSLAEIEDDELAIEMRAADDPVAAHAAAVVDAIPYSDGDAADRAELAVDVDVELDVDVDDLDDLIEAVDVPPALAVVELRVPRTVPRSYGTALLAAFAVLVILAAAGVLLFYPR
jgi:hypothetical protein